ncbi:MAG: DUF192 domain-containing protein [Melioribacteraceae bacterium]|jgi:uncharacterized membrane protein (UPF0127 family)|nr:DUF192 domain-containing protein [Melioribacteraceae bacterium]
MNKKNHNSKNGFTKIVSVVIILSFVIFLVLYNLPQTQKNGNATVKTSSIKFNKDGELTFQSKDGIYISKIDIEIADDDDKRTKGLMDRLSMKEYQGMLFIFPYETIQSFWMKNTVLSLDIIFVNRDNEIVTIHQHAVPFDIGQYASTKPASRVVEVNAGYTELYGINVGDKIVWRRN